MQSPQETAKSSALWVASCQKQLEILRRLQGAKVPCSNIAEARGAVLLVEPREDPNLEFTLRNWMHFMAPRITASSSSTAAK